MFSNLMCNMSFIPVELDIINKDQFSEFIFENENQPVCSSVSSSSP